MSGYTLPPNVINLANGITGSDVTYPTDTTGITAQNALLTSLYSITQKNNGGTFTNGFTVNMQTIDTPGNTGNTYYAIRVNTDNTSILYANIRMYSIKLTE